MSDQDHEVLSGERKTGVSVQTQLSKMDRVKRIGYL